MADVWPVTLPQQFLEDGFSESPLGNTIESQPEAGALQMRRRFTAVPRAVTVQLYLTSSQKSDLDTFWASHTAVRFQWTNAQGSTRYYLFRRPPSYRSRVPGFMVSLDLLEFVAETGGA